MYVYISFVDNGYEFDHPQHEDAVLGVYGERPLAELALTMNGFTERDSADNYWNGTQCGWVERHEVESSYERVMRGGKGKAVGSD